MKITAIATAYYDEQRYKENPKYTFCPSFCGETEKPRTDFCDKCKIKISFETFKYETEKELENYFKDEEFKFSFDDLIADVRRAQSIAGEEEKGRLVLTQFQRSVVNLVARCDRFPERVETYNMRIKN